jgi:Ca2+-binding RTX toxin-like protein
MGADNYPDTLHVDMVCGSTFALPDGLHFHGGTGGEDQLSIGRRNGDTTYLLDNSMLSTPPLNVTYDGVELFEIDDRGGDDTYAFSTKKKHVTLHDQDGTDTLDFSNAIKRVILKLLYSDGRSQWIHAGNNRLALDGIFENAVGTSFADNITGNEADNVITTGAGNDTVYGRPGNDVIDVGDGSNIAAGNRHDDTLIGGADDDRLNGGGGRDTIDGGGGDDVVYGFKGHDLIRGGDGNDALTAGDGDDVVIGGAGQDELFGALGRDVLIGGDGPDSLRGAVGEDMLIGSWTAYDSDDAALEAILAEWRSSRSIDERIHNLRFGEGLSQGYPLDPSIFDDMLEDYLEGGWGADWFYPLRGDTFAPGEPEPSDRVTYAP